MGVLVVGSVALDSVKTPFGVAEDALGGSATFFSVAASYFTDVALVAVVGPDFPQEHIDFFRSRGIDITGLTVVEGKTFRWSGVYGVDLNDRDTIDTQLGVFEGFRPSVPKGHLDSEFVFLANIDPELQGTVLEQVATPTKLGPLGLVEVLIMNDSECRELSGEPNLIKAARMILEMGPTTVVVKKGEHGALMCTADGFFSAPAYPCESVFDPTGAGDSFAGGFMGHLAATRDTSESNIRRAVIYGTVMASFSVEQFSVDGMTRLERSDIERRFRMLKQVSHFEP